MPKYLIASAFAACCLSVSGAAIAEGVAILAPTGNATTIKVPNAGSRNIYVHDHDPGPDMIATIHLCNQSTTTSVNVVSNDDTGAGIIILAPGDCGVVSGRRVEAVNPSTPSEEATVQFTVLAIAIDGAPN